MNRALHEVRFQVACVLLVGAFGIFALTARQLLAQAYDLLPGGGPVPAGAMVAGSDAEGAQLFVCVAESWGGEHPGVLLEDGSCEVPWGGKVHRFEEGYMVLMGGSGSWETAGRGAIPRSAFIAGDDGGPLFVCRADLEGGLYPGKLGEDGWCYIAAAGREHTLTSGYEILVE